MWYNVPVECPALRCTTSSGTCFYFPDAEGDRAVDREHADNEGALTSHMGALNEVGEQGAF